MAVVGKSIHIGLASSILFGGCLLSFVVGRWSSGQMNPAMENSVDRVVVAIESSPGRSAKGQNVPAVRYNTVEQGNPESGYALDEKFDEDRFYGARLQQRISELRELGALDPLRALELAEHARYELDRRSLRLAAIEGWARVDVAGAIDAALDFESEEIEPAVCAALRGGARQPGLARVVLEDLQARGELSTGGLKAAQFAFVAALSVEGHFSEAIDYARSDSGVGNRTELMKASFAQWGRFEPESAVLAAMDLEEKRERDAAFSVVATAWGGVDPGGLAEFAVQLAPGEQREVAIKRALPQWVATAPAEAAVWLEARESASELDVGILALATHPYLAERSPQVALSWAEALWDKNLRADTLSLVVKQWAATDRQAAIEYIRTSDEFPLPERQELLALFGERKEFGIDGPLE